MSNIRETVSSGTADSYKGLNKIIHIVGAFCLRGMLLDLLRSSGGAFILHVVAFITPVRRVVSLKAPPDSIT